MGKTYVHKKPQYYMDKEGLEERISQLSLDEQRTYDILGVAYTLIREDAGLLMHEVEKHGRKLKIHNDKNRSKMARRLAKEIVHDDDLNTIDTQKQAITFPRKPTVKRG